MVRFYFLLILLTAFSASACSGSSSPTQVSVNEDPISTLQTTNPAAQSVPSADRPEWQTIEFVDAQTGNTFTFADFEGKTVFVESMATWCTNCRRQLGNVRAAREQLADDENFVFVGLSVETNLSNTTLAEYTQDEGFPWTFAVVTPTALQSLVGTFGRTVSNPPSTPHFIIRPDGTFTEMSTGFASPEEIIEALRNASEV